MRKNEHPSLAARLRSWNPRLPADPFLAARVRQRIHAAETNAAVPGTHLNRFRLVAYGALAALVLIGVFLASQQLERSRLLRDGSYCLMIDPVFRAQSVGAQAQSGQENADTYLERLAWMQDRLALTPGQFLQLVELHRDYSDRFDRLYLELIELDREYGQFEELRQKDAAIDFMALYEVLQERRIAEAASNSLSREFIRQVLSFLDNDQKQAYLSMVQPVNG